MRDAQGNELAQDNDIDTNAGNYHSFITVTLPADGTYEIWANGLDATARGQYRLIVIEPTSIQPRPVLSELALLQVEANRLLKQGGQQFQAGQFYEALQSWESSLNYFLQIGDRLGEARVLGDLGLVYSSMGDYAEAISFHQQSLDIKRKLRNRQEEAKNLGNLGVAFAQLGQYDQAIAFYQQQLSIVTELGDRQGEAHALGNLGLVYQSLEQYEHSIEYHQQSLRLSQEIGDQQTEANALGNLGVTYYFLEQDEQSLEFTEQYLAVTRKIGDRRGEANALGILALIHREVENYEQAIAFNQQYLAMSREIGDRLNVAYAFANLGVTYIKTNQYNQAENYLYQALLAFESLRDSLSDDQLISIIDTQSRIYTHLSNALIAQDRPIDALAIVERGKAQAFALLLARHVPDSQNQAAQANDTTSILSIQKIQQVARETNTTLVEYEIVFDRVLHIWVVHPSGHIDFQTVEFNANDTETLTTLSGIGNLPHRGIEKISELTTLVTDTRASITVESANINAEQLKELYKILIAPIDTLLPDNPEAKVVFIPQSSLFLVPFAALQHEDGTYLIEKHTILSAPSIQVYGLANRVNYPMRDRTSTALVVGNPTMPTIWTSSDKGDLIETQLRDLPGAKIEADEIANLLRVSPLTGAQATEARIKQLMPPAGIIHLATHGLLGYGNPQTSGFQDLPGAIALATGQGEDGLLTSAEIFTMDLQADLAILSACDTGRGRITGDGVVGLSRAFIAAEVPSVVVSLWQVPDSPTAMLMTEFYRQLDDGQDKAQALRHAMLRTMEQHPDPIDWSAFTLMGKAI